MSEDILKLYEGVVWVKDSDEPGKRVSIYAVGPLEAKEKIRKQYGNNTIVSLENKEESERLSRLLKYLSSMSAKLLVRAL